MRNKFLFGIGGCVAIAAITAMANIGPPPSENSPPEKVLVINPAPENAVAPVAEFRMLTETASLSAVTGFIDHLTMNHGTATISTPSGATMKVASIERTGLTGPKLVTASSIHIHCGHAAFAWLARDGI